MCFSVEVLPDISLLSTQLGSSLNQAEYNRFAAQHSLKPKDYKWTGTDQRLFPKVFSWVLTKESFTPMRYQLLPHFCDENKYTRINPDTGRKNEIKNTFNARLDSLAKRKAWQGLFMKNHAVLPLTRFYEWVPGHDRKPKLISFHSSENEILYAPCLYDHWTSLDGEESFYSFAIITDSPPEEALRTGHDRCPAFINESQIKNWLNPQGQSVQSIYQILQEKQDDYFLNQWA